MADVATVARWLGISERQVHDMARQGLLPRQRRGEYDLERCVQDYCRRQREIAAGRASPDGRADIVAERARLAREQADRLAMQNAEMRGELLPAGDVEEILVTLHSNVQRVLLAVPATVARLVASENDPAVCEGIIRDHQVEALEQLANAKIQIGPPGQRRASDKRKGSRGVSLGVQAPAEAHD